MAKAYPGLQPFLYRSANAVEHVNEFGQLRDKLYSYLSGIYPVCSVGNKKKGFEWFISNICCCFLILEKILGIFLIIKAEVRFILPRKINGRFNCGNT